MEFDWNTILVALAAIAGILVLTARIIGKMEKATEDAKVGVQLLKEVQTAFLELWDELVEANEDGQVTQLEFNRLIEKATPIKAKIEAVIAQGKVLQADVESIKADIDALIASWRK